MTDVTFHLTFGMEMVVDYVYLIMAIILFAFGTIHLYALYSVHKKFMETGDVIDRWVLTKEILLITMLYVFAYIFVYQFFN